ncbi:YdeI/OmpD-associated family protein, partial [Escherichia coli]|nr:YdeI/OmpD-associated family protein [Escherichia coli]
IWSKRNVELVARLVAEGRMRPEGQAEIDRAKADGRWDAAYAGPATMTMDAELAAALELVPGASARFEGLPSQERYSVLQRLGQAK